MSDEELRDSSELYEHFRFEADKGQSLIRLDKYLSQRMEAVSRSRIQSAADAGNILVNGDPVKSSYKVKPGDIVAILLPHPPRSLEILPEDIPLSIVYEDEELIVVNKPAGMVVHPAHGNFDGTLVNALMFHLKDNPLFANGSERPGLVHRIDKDTSGLLVVGKTDRAVNKLARQFFEKTSERTYHAIIWGNLDEDEGTITGNIGRHPKERKKMYVFPDGEQGKPAVTHYKVLERFGYVTLVECRLETGRTHQIRVHFQYLKHPLFNDAEYGGDQILRGTTFTKYKQFIQNCFQILPRQALHAKTLGFKHPATGEMLRFDSELPEDMETVIEKWRTYTGNREFDE